MKVRSSTIPVNILSVNYYYSVTRSDSGHDANSVVALRLFSVINDTKLIA